MDRPSLGTEEGHAGGAPGSLAEFDPATGTLLVAFDTSDALLHHAGLQERPPTDLKVHLDVLRSCGALHGEAPHPAVGRSLQAIAAPTATLVLLRGGATARGWLAPHASTLSVPVSAHCLEISCVAPGFVPGLLARLVELKPRSTPGTGTIELSTADAARLIAVGLGDPAPDSADPRMTVRDHWLVEVSYADGATETCEVLDTKAGLYSVTAQGNVVRAAPVTATAVWRALVRLFAGWTTEADVPTG